MVFIVFGDCGRGATFWLRQAQWAGMLGSSRFPAQAHQFIEFECCVGILIRRCRHQKNEVAVGGDS
ncbi:MAG: hypothetical protein DMG85_00795 [Acidobacteria bacterium]|nr:MAG: hypothetical protein DMG85_00795 [Acidobacteriota bacterium]